MLALQKMRPGAGFELREIPQISTIAPNEVLVRVHATGVCGTDLHIAAWTPGYESMQSAMPVTLGHEFAGTIVAVGAGVESSMVGTSVTARPSVVCGTCAGCRNDDEDNCTGRRGVGIGRNGALASHVAVPAANCVPLPSGLDFEIAALTEPMTVCAEAVDTGEVKKGDRVLVLGPGFIGQGIALFCEEAGAAEIVIGGHSDGPRLATLNELGFKDTVDTAGSTLGEVLAPYLEKGGFDVVIEATGAPQVVSQALACLKKRGVMVIAGIHPQPASIDLTALVRNHQQLRGSYRSPLATWGRVLDYLAANQQRVRGLITHRFDLADAADGFDLAQSKTASKVVIRHPQD